MSNSDSTKLMATGFAVDEWNKGNKQYLSDTWSCKQGTSPDAEVKTQEATAKTNLANIKNCNQFRNIVWKTADKVAFAYRDNWVVVWISYSSAQPVDEKYPDNYGTPSVWNGNIVD